MVSRSTVIVATVSALAFAACFTDEAPEQTTTPITGASSSSSSSGESMMTTSLFEGSTDVTGTQGTTAESTTEDPTEDPTTGGDPVYSCPESPDLVLCYEFETGWSDSSLLDTSDSLYHGFMVGVAQVPGHSGSAALLDEASTVFAPYDEQIFQRLLNEFTVAAWIHPSAEGLSGTRGIVERDGNIRLALVGGGESYELSCDSPGAGTVLSASSLKPGAWVHAACVYDGESLSLWVDGVLSTQIAGKIAVIGDDSLRIGNDGPAVGAASAFVGLIDEVQIWELALTGQALCGAAGIAGCS